MRGTEDGYFVKASTSNRKILLSLIKSRLFSLKNNKPKDLHKMQKSSLRSITSPASDLIFSYNCSIFHLLISTLLPF